MGMWESSMRLQTCFERIFFCCNHGLGVTFHNSPSHTFCFFTVTLMNNRIPIVIPHSNIGCTFSSLSAYLKGTSVSTKLPTPA